jgi:hypothetical protein
MLLISTFIGFGPRYSTHSSGAYAMRFTMILTPELKTAVENWRRIQDEIPSRIEAVRALLELALKAEGIEIEREAM